MSAYGILGNPTAYVLFKLMDCDRQYLGELFDKTIFSKREISKYIAQMELAGIIRGDWERGDDRRWRRYYRATDNEWARLLREVIKLIQEEK